MTGEQLPQRRLALGLSRRQLAVRLCVSDQTVRSWEPGRTRILWLGMLEFALEAIETRLARGGLGSSSSDAAS